jgi:hypothetical protein
VPYRVPRPSGFRLRRSVVAQSFFLSLFWSTLLFSIAFLFPHSQEGLLADVFSKEVVWYAVLYLPIVILSAVATGCTIESDGQKGFGYFVYIALLAYGFVMLNTGVYLMMAGLASVTESVVSQPPGLGGSYDLDTAEQVGQTLFSLFFLAVYLFVVVMIMAVFISPFLIIAVPVSAVGLRTGSKHLRDSTVVVLDDKTPDSVGGEESWVLVTLVPWCLSVFGISVWYMSSFPLLAGLFGALSVGVLVCLVLFGNRYSWFEE